MNANRIPVFYVTVACSLLLFHCFSTIQIVGKNSKVSNFVGGLRGREVPPLQFSTLETRNWIYAPTFILENEQFFSTSTSANISFTCILALQRRWRPKDILIICLICLHLSFQRGLDSTAPKYGYKMDGSAP